jgi:LPXTG-motif cell wall-anchored protein
VHEIQIRDHEKVYELSLTNDKIPERPNTPDNPKTGDDSNALLWIAIAGIAAAGLTLLAALKRKERKSGREETK